MTPSLLCWPEPDQVLAQVRNLAVKMASDHPGLERALALRSLARAWLTPVLPVDLDLLITDAATAAHWAGSRWPVLGHIHREGRPLHAA